MALFLHVLALLSLSSPATAPCNGHVQPSGSSFVVRPAGQTHAYTMWDEQSAPPGAPQNLTGSVSGAAVSLNWMPPSTGDPPRGYQIEASASPGGAVIATVSVPGTSLVVPNLPHGVHYVRVRAVNGDGPSIPSNEVSLVVPGSGLAANAPPGMYFFPELTLKTHGPSASSNEVSVNLGSTCQLAGASTLRSPSVAGSTVTLNWSSPDGVVTSYVIEGGSTPGATNLLKTTTSATSYTWSAAASGTSYIRVRALNSCGAGAASNEMTASVGAACQVPGTPVLLSPTISGSSVSFSWRSAGGGATGYAVEAGSTSGAANLLNTITSGTSYTWSGAPGGTSYLRVTAINSCGTGAASNQITATVSGDTPPPAPPPPSGANPFSAR